MLNAYEIIVVRNSRLIAAFTWSFTGDLVTAIFSGIDNEDAFDNIVFIITRQTQKNQFICIRACI